MSGEADGADAGWSEAGDACGGEVGSEDAGSRETDGGGGDITLAFDLGALEALADPRAVFADARRWSRHVGAVANDAEAVEAFARRHGVRQDYEIGDLDRRGVLSRLRWEADTERFVLVGTDERDRELADHVGWEYLPVEEAAERAGWTLAEDASVVDRLLIRLSRLSRLVPWHAPSR